MSYRPACTRPCSECPFRRKSTPGWLGAATPQSFIIEISMERPLPCHTSIDYEIDDWSSAWATQQIGLICAGSLILSANMSKLPRDRMFPRMRRNTKLVFSNHIEFIKHHEAAPVRSWETKERRERR